MSLGLRRLVSVLLFLIAPSAAFALPLNVGHRGYSAAYPENTLVAVEAAYQGGADIVEIDLLKSSDGEVVIFHDNTLDRTTNGSGAVAGHTLAQLKDLDAGSWFSSAFVGEPIPTLQEALQLQQQLGQGPLLLDQKSGLTFGAEIAAALAATGASAIDDIWVTAWTLDQVNDIRALLPDTFILWTGNDPATNPLSPADMQALGVGGFSHIFETYASSPGFQAEVQALGMQAFAWNLDILLPETPEKMQQAIDMGLDGYIVNDPAVFEALLLPEPTTALLVGMGLAFAAARGRLRHPR